MRTNIDLDDELVAEAMRLTAAPTKREVVHRALRLLIEELRRKDLRDLHGKIRFRSGYDPHEARSR